MKVLELPVSDLKVALAGFNKVLVNRVLPILGCIRVQPTTQGVDLQVTDLDSFATCRIAAEAPADFPPCLISMAGLAKVAKTAKDRIVLVHEDALRMKVRHFIGSHPVEQPIECLPIEDWPPSPQLKAKPFRVEPGFKEAFRHAMECASADSTRVILNGVFLDLTQLDCHCLVGTDGRHLFSANTFHVPFTESVIIPSHKFFNWAGFAEDGDWLLAVEPPVMKGDEVLTPAFVQIESERWTFLTKGIDGRYPNWRQVMPCPDRLLTRVMLTDEAVGVVLDALPRMPGTEESNQPVTIVLQAGQLILRSRPSCTDQWTEVPVPGATVAGLDQRVCLNRTFITKALRFGFTEFEVQDALSPVVFIAPGKKLLAMIMRSDDAPATAQDAQDEAQPEQPSPQAAVTPTEVTPVAPDPPQESENNTEQTTTMERNNITTLPAPERGNLKPTTTNGSNGETATGLKAVVEQVERIKTNLRDVISDLNGTLDLLKAAEKEKKATLKEVESIRSTLRSLQKVEL